MGQWSSGVKRGHIPRVISQNVQGFRRWSFQGEVYTPSPSFHVKISFVQICFRLAPFSAFIYWTTHSRVYYNWSGTPLWRNIQFCLTLKLTPQIIYHWKALFFLSKNIWVLNSDSWSVIFYGPVCSTLPLSFFQHFW